MKEHLSPKQVAQAIGVSESSLKRWCDQGRIETVRTAGGHRRLPLSAVMAFLRETRQPLVRPEVLGLPTNTGRGTLVLDRARENLFEALVVGDEEMARQIVVDLYLAEQRISTIGDQVLAPAFRKVGEKWGCGDVEVYQERRGCEIAQRLLGELRVIMPPPKSDAPVAVGGTPEGDFYRLPTAAVELVLRECGWRATNLGSSLPCSTLSAAIERTQPRLFWLSVSYVRNEDELVETTAVLFDECRKRHAAMAVGGFALSESLRGRLHFSAHCDQLRHLESFVSTVASDGDGRAREG